MLRQGTIVAVACTAPRATPRTDKTHPTSATALHGRSPSTWETNDGTRRFGYHRKDTYLSPIIPESCDGADQIDKTSLIASYSDIRRTLRI